MTGPRLQSFYRRARRRLAAHPFLAGFAILAIAILVGRSGWLLTRPGAPFGPQDGTWLRSQINRDLYVGIEPNYPPFAEWTPDGIQGIEADIAREIGERLGVETSILIMGFDGLYDALYTGTVDFVISGLRVDSSRTEWVHYTKPYFDAGLVLVSPRDHAYQTMRDLDKKRVAVEMASQGDLAAQRWARRLHALEIVRTMLPQDAIAAVQHGDADAALIDMVSARLHIDEYPGLTLADDVAQPDPYVIALRQENFRMIEEVEQALQNMKDDGTLDAILDRWLNTPTQEENHAP